MSRQPRLDRGPVTSRARTVAAALLLVLATGCGSSEPGPTAPAAATGPAASSAGESAAAATPSRATPSGAPASAAPPSSRAPTAERASRAPGSDAAPTVTATPTPPTTQTPPTTAVPAPTAGDVNQTVAAKKEVSKRPVRLEQPSDAGAGVQVRIRSVKAITAKAQLPGEVAGPAVALTVSVRNRSSRPLDLNAVVVTLTDATQAPGNEMSAKPARPLTGHLPVGRTSVGVYVFTVDQDRRNPVSVAVTLAGEAPVVVFKGDAR